MPCTDLSGRLYGTSVPLKEGQKKNVGRRNSGTLAVSRVINVSRTPGVQNFVFCSGIAGRTLLSHRGVLWVDHGKIAELA